MSGIPVPGVLEKIESFRLPPSLIKYLWCCPALDFKFRAMPSSGGLVNQRYRDFLEFNIIETRIRNIEARERFKKG
mgnify:CR=1 FL=1